MDTVVRLLDLQSLLQKKSILLFGPRATGKSTLIRSQLVGSKFVLIDLLKSSFYIELSADPSKLESMVLPGKKGTFPLVVIDEVQRIPALLNEAHRLIEEKGMKFLLTGSSARRLKREGANMLAGRAWRAELFPLIVPEIPDFKLERALRFGTLPGVYLGKDPEEDLEAYVSTYLKEEIEVECRLRNLPAFSRFLKVAALSSGQLINYAHIGSDAQVAVTTVKSYFEILQDTLLGRTIEPFLESKKRKAIATNKFYLFDNGVRNTLLQVDSLDRNSDLYGSAFEAWALNEILAYISYKRLKKNITYWRSTSGHEVDFLIGHSLAIELKATRKVNDRDFRGLGALAEEGLIKNYVLVSQDPIERWVDIGSGKKALALPWALFLEKLWDGEFN